MAYFYTKYPTQAGDITKCIDVDDMIDVDLYIVVEYGISVTEVCNSIKEVVRYKLEQMTGIKVRNVNITVEGIRV